MQEGERVIIDHSLGLDAYIVWIEGAGSPEPPRKRRCATIAEARALAAALAARDGLEMDDRT